MLTTGPVSLNQESSCGRSTTVTLVDFGIMLLALATCAAPRSQVSNGKSGTLCKRKHA